MKYWFDGKKMHTVSGKVTKNWIYQKNGAYRNPHDSLSINPKSAIRVYLRKIKEQYKCNDNSFQEALILQKKLLRQIKKIENSIKKKGSRYE